MKMKELLKNLDEEDAAAFKELQNLVYQIYKRSGVWIRHTAPDVSFDIYELASKANHIISHWTESEQANVEYAPNV